MKPIFGSRALSFKRPLLSPDMEFCGCVCGCVCVRVFEAKCLQTVADSGYFSVGSL